MNSTDDPLSHASLSEIWGVIWLRYIAAMGFVVLIYDTLLTLDDEVRLIFSYFFSRLTACSFPDAPCLARAPFLAKITLFHQSLPIHYHYPLCKLPSVPHFLWLMNSSVERLPEISGLHPPLTDHVGCFHSPSSAPKILTCFSCPFPCMRLSTCRELTEILVVKL